jgi:predicted O-linked N-acetylglucosamine transferase (SPINDLY family)
VLTFGCLNQFAKVSRRALRVWIDILRALPRSRMVIHSQPGSHRDAVRELFRDGGIADNRIEFAAKVSQVAYFGQYSGLDLCLDPFPFNGGITTMDSLWMGVPVITLSGRTAVGRGGVSILSNLGLPDLIAQTPQQYVDIAVELAGDLSRLSDLRASLRERVRSSPLMDGARYSADVETVFRQTWQTWCHSGA